MLEHISKAQIERTARIYKTNTDASRALGITPRHYSRLCLKYGIESPNERKKHNAHKIASL